jgi:hypothetical protein
LRAEPRAGGVQPGNGATAASSSEDVVKTTTLEWALSPPPDVTLPPTEPPALKPRGDLGGTFESEPFQRLLDEQPPCLATVFSRVRDEHGRLERSFAVSGFLQATESHDLQFISW